MKKNITWIAGLVAFVLLLVGASLLYNKLGEDFDKNSLLDNNDSAINDSKDDSSNENNDNPTNNNDNTENNGESGENNQDISSDDEKTEEKPFPSADFTVYTLDGKAVKLSDMRGKPIVINFWATWCPNCVVEMPTFNEVYDEYKDKVVFMMINCAEPQSEVEDYLTKNELSLPVYMDHHYEAAIAYGASSIPLTVFFDADGNIVNGYFGALDADFLKGKIDQIINK